MSYPAMQAKVEAVRRFNRFYTRTIGVLDQGYLDTDFSVTEARTLYEIAHRPGVTAKVLTQELGIDTGYMSRMLSNFEKDGLLIREPSKQDRRQRMLSLTRRGEEEFATLNVRSRDFSERLLDRLDGKTQNRLVDAMQFIEQSLHVEKAETAPYILRPHKPGDLGWITHRQAVMYYNEYGWGEKFEALVAEILADFGANFKPDKERSWIAEMNGEIVGSVFCQYESDDDARLRLLYVEPKARGHQLGTRLVQECVDFAREAGYKKITLWSQDCLLVARKIYANLGFTILKTQSHADWGEVVNGEYWELDLSTTP